MSRLNSFFSQPPTGEEPSPAHPEEFSFTSVKGADWTAATCDMPGAKVVGGGCDAYESPWLMQKAGMKGSDLKAFECGGQGGKKEVWAQCMTVKFSTQPAPLPPRAPTGGAPPSLRSSGGTPPSNNASAVAAML